MSALPQLIEEDVEALNRALQSLLEKSEVNMVLLIDKAGFIVTHRGEKESLDATTLAALSAGAYAATESIASLVSEPNFSSVFQQGENFSLLVQNVDDSTLLASVFKSHISAGAVKYYSAETIPLLAKQLKLAHRRNPGACLDLSTLNIADPSILFRKKSA